MKTNALKIAGAFLALSAATAWAVPTLQLDIGYVDGGGNWVRTGVYDPIGETTVATSPTFTLRALLSSDGTPPLSTSFNLSMTVMQDGSPATDLTSPTFGPIVVDGTAYNAGDFTFGDDPNLPGNQPSFWTAIPFTFSGATTPSYNTQDGASASGTLYYHDFQVDASWLLEHLGTYPGDPNVVTPLNDLYDIEFNVYGGPLQGSKATWVNPGSHDASTWYGVPDGGTTMLLLGLGLLGMRILRRHRK